MELNDHEEALRGEHVLQYPYRRATGPILGRFFTEISWRWGQRVASRVGPGCTSPVRAIRWSDPLPGRSSSSTAQTRLFYTP